MCVQWSGLPVSGWAQPEAVGAAMGQALAGLGWVAGAELESVPVADQAECLRQLERAEAMLTAARARVLTAFHARGGYAEDGQGTSRTWLKWQTRVTDGAASGAVGWMRRLSDHAGVAAALGEARISVSWARQMCAWTDRLPDSARPGADEILLEAASAGLRLEELAGIFQEMLRKLARPDRDKDFEDRQVHLGITFEGAGRLEGDLTPQCAEAVKSVLDALSKKRGPEDVRTRAQRRHDALHEAFRRLAAAGNLPDRAGQPTQIQLHITLDDLLRRLNGEQAAPQAREAAPRLQAGELPVPGPACGWPLAGPGDECDASIAPIVTGTLDHDLLAKLAAAIAAHGSPQVAVNMDSIRDLIVANAAALFSGPRGLASWLRRRVLDGAAASVSLPLDTGTSTETIPPHLRRAVIKRDRHCAAPGCDQPPAACQVHHVTPRSQGGITKLTNLLLLCSFHHLILVHRWGWTITLNADGTTTMTSPDGTKIFHSHSPPVVAA